MKSLDKQISAWLFLDAMQRRGLTQCCDTPNAVPAARRARFEREVTLLGRGLLVVASLLRTGRHPAGSSLLPSGDLSAWLSRAAKTFNKAVDSVLPRTARKLKYVPFYRRGKRKSLMIDVHTLVVAVLSHNAERRVAISTLLSKRFAGHVDGMLDLQLASAFAKSDLRSFFEKVITS